MPFRVTLNRSQLRRSGLIAHPPLFAVLTRFASLQAEALQHTPAYAHCCILVAPAPAAGGTSGHAQEPDAGLQQRVAALRRAQLDRFRAKTGAAVFPVPPPPGTRARLVRGVAQAEAAQWWPEVLLARLDAAADKENRGGGRADAAEGARARVLLGLQVRTASSPTPSTY